MERIFLAALLLLAPPLPALEPLPGPDVVVRSLYTAQEAGEGPLFQSTDRTRVDRWFIPALADLIWRDANGPKDEVGVIDGDPLYDAQDMEITDQLIHPANIDGDDAEVLVTFANFGEKKEITYLLQRSPDGNWRVANVDWGHATLYRVLKDGLPE